MAEGLEAAKPVIRALCEAQAKLIGECGKPVGDFPFFPDYTEEQLEAVTESIGDRLQPVLGIVAKAERDEALNDLTASVVEELAERFPEEEGMLAAAVNAAFKKTMRHHVLTEGVRMDGRTPVEIRTITAEAGVLPRVHGSALFQRGETQILGVTTLNMLKMEQQLDNLSPATHRRYIHHYNFPPYSTGETGRVGSPKRREIGHGHLAEIALESQLPSREEFPYAIRQVSETMGSNGSSSMGSVCASTLSLYNAGVPLKAPVAGIAMGLVSDTIDGETKYCTLTDILGAEDALGDMDFKVAGTREYVTALQLDTKLDGIPAAVLDAALTQARDARFAILDLIAEAIDGPDELASTAPRIIAVKIPVDKIGEVIGPKGKMINQIQEDTGAEITIEDDGTVFIGATDGPSAEAARAAINGIANPQMPRSASGSSARSSRRPPSERSSHSRRAATVSSTSPRSAGSSGAGGSRTSRTSSTSETRSRWRSARSTPEAKSPWTPSWRSRRPERPPSRPQPPSVPRAANAKAASGVRGGVPASAAARVEDAAN